MTACCLPRASGIPEMLVAAQQIPYYVQRLRAQLAHVPQSAVACPWLSKVWAVHPCHLRPAVFAAGLLVAAALWVGPAGAHGLVC
jgi:uncharacterized protein (DUF1786 family)